MNFRVRSISTRIAMNDIDLTKDSSFSDVLKCEHQYLKVPLESLKKSMRNNHRIIERELAAITQGVTEAAKTINTKEDAYKKTENLLARLHVLKRKVCHLFCLSVFLLYAHKANFRLKKPEKLTMTSPESLKIEWIRFVLQNHLGKKRLTTGVDFASTGLS